MIPGSASARERLRWATVSRPDPGIKIEGTWYATLEFQ